MFKRLLKDESGVAMTEYIIILALVAVASIAIISVFGKRIKAMFTNATTELNNIKSTSETTVSPSGK